MDRPVQKLHADALLKIADRAAPIFGYRHAGVEALWSAAVSAALD